MVMRNPQGCDGLTIPCCPNNVAERVVASISETVNCACASGTIQMAWNTALSAWKGEGSFCNGTVTLTLSCTSDACTGLSLLLEFSGIAGCGSKSELADGATCSCAPFSLTFNYTLDDSCCDEEPEIPEIEVVITES